MMNYIQRGVFIGLAVDKNVPLITAQVENTI
jgi:hypothetical protein